KTGTTGSYADAWFDGYTPSLEATVWIGYPSGEIPMTNVHGIEVSGPTFPATIWRLFMERAIDLAPFPTAFPVAIHSPVWVSHTLQWAMSGAYSAPSSGSGTYYAPPATTTTGTTGTRKPSPPANPTPPPAPPPTTTPT